MLPSNRQLHDVVPEQLPTFPPTHAQIKFESNWRLTMVCGGCALPYFQTTKNVYKNNAATLEIFEELHRLGCRHENIFTVYFRAFCSCLTFVFQEIPLLQYSSSLYGHVRLSQSPHMLVPLSKKGVLGGAQSPHLDKT